MAAIYGGNYRGDVGPARPSSIQELASKAHKFTDLWDPSRELRYWLRVAEQARHAGQNYERSNDLENAFVEYAKAATLILQKIPSHREFNSRLDSTQRETLSSKGKGVLDRMSEIKPVLAERHNAWESSQARAGISSRTSQSNSGANAQTSCALDDAQNRTRAPLSRHNSASHSSSSSGVQIWYPNAAVEAQEKRKRDEVMRMRAEQRTRSEQVGIIQRQRAAEEEAAAARRSLTPRPNPAPVNISASYTTPTRSGYDTFDPPPILPLESPTRFEADSTDSELNGDEKLYSRVQKLGLGSNPPLVSAFGAPVHPPITTTSPPPPTLNTIRYPDLMSQHQRSQGYTPSLQSMFLQRAPDVPQSNLLLDASSSGLYNSLLPAPSRPVSAPRARDIYPQQYSTQPLQLPSRDRSSRSPTPEPTRPPIPPHPSHDYPTTQQQPRIVAPEPISRSSSGTERKDPVKHSLRTVLLPRDVLPRFLSIASLNTSLNRETCGLLMGKVKGERYIVTTLLIPKQHSTSDTCTMDEEELVMDFSEKRSLMTLGWIHTHPTQSCFMSSVDLHTHSGFQCMLPEAFAVVCAPTSTPNFGIFRLTDPPGLKIILDCNAKEAFHPHLDAPIYTDADKGHVQMRDITLEIVDLR